MMNLKITGKFRKDYKRCKKRGLDMNLLKEVINTLLSGKPLEEKYRDHGLVGQYAGHRECHILPDWLLIYYVNNESLILTAVRTGTHSDLLDL